MLYRTIIAQASLTMVTYGCQNIIIVQATGVNAIKRVNLLLWMFRQNKRDRFTLASIFILGNIFKKAAA
jgi:hypothetical protein